MGAGRDTTCTRHGQCTSSYTVDWVGPQWSGLQDIEVAVLREVLGRIVAAVGGNFVEWDYMADNWVEGSLEQDCIAGVVEPVEPGCIVEGCETSLAFEILGWDDIVEVGAFVKCNAAVVVVEWEHNVVAVVDEESGESVVVVEGCSLLYGVILRLLLWLSGFRYGNILYWRRRIGHLRNWIKR